MTADTRTTWAKKRTHWARENSAYLNRLLSDKHPEYLTALRRAEVQVDRELSKRGAP